MAEPSRRHIPLASGADGSCLSSTFSCRDVRGCKELKDGKNARIYNISVKMQKAGGVAMVHELHVGMSVMWQSVFIIPEWKKGLVFPI